MSSPCLETGYRTRRWAVYKLCFGPPIAVTLVEVVVGFDGRFCSCIWLMRAVPNNYSPPGTVHLHGHLPCWLVQVDTQPHPHMYVVLRCGYLTANRRDKTLPPRSTPYGGGAHTVDVGQPVRVYSSYFRYFGTTLPPRPPCYGFLLSMLPPAEPMRTRLNLMDCGLNDTFRPRMEAHEFV